MKIPEQPTRWRVFLRKPLNRYKDFYSADEAWEFLKSFKPPGPHQLPYIHPIVPGGPEFPVKPDPK